MGDARKNEGVHILYVAASSWSLDDGGVQHPKGRSLARHLSTQHELRVCAGIVAPDSPVLQGPEPASVRSADALNEFDVVYIEDGWSRFPLELAMSYVRRGGQLIVADVGRHTAKAQRESLEQAADLFGASVRFRKVGRKKGICYLYDEDQALYQEGHDGDPRYDLQLYSGTRYFVSQMIYVHDWLIPALEGIDSIVASQAVHLETLGADTAASGNANTAVMEEGVVVQGNRGLLTWASVNAYGLGHAVLVGADVSEDRLVDRCPDNASWISNLIAVLTERSRETAGWAAPAQQQKSIDMPNLHPSISAASGVHFANRHYDDAVFAALKTVEHRVQTLAGRRDSGKTLMANVFNEKSAMLDIAHDHADERQKADEAEGFKFLFMGATQGLRNPRAHGAHLQTEEQEAIELLATASLLMRALDRAEKRLP
jgi:uncharacterized protein (TIGR02391 family)